MATNPVKSKVKAAGIGAAIAAIVAWIVGMNGIDMPPGVEAAITTLVGVFAGYMKREMN